MSNTKEVFGMSSSVEWRIQVGEGSKEILVPEPKNRVQRLLAALQGLFVDFTLKICNFFKKAWKIGVDDPRKFAHGLRVGVALCVVSLFYYMRPLYNGVGGNAIWAVMTVVVVFEYTVGATLYKSLNRICATCLAGFLAIGVHWVASQSGTKFEPFILGASVFLLASAATFSRFIPVVKARFDYGVTIFILTFSLVSVSGYRVEKLLDLAHQRLATIIIGTALCMVTAMVVYPIWAGEELHFLIIRNMEKVSDSLDGCVADYFKDDEANPNNDEACSKNLEAYKSALNSKGSEDAMANFARWEPAHGLFTFNHPWKQYLKVSAALRNCAYCIEALNSCLYSENKSPDFVKIHLGDSCSSVSSHSCEIIKELAQTIKTMTRSSQIDMSVMKLNDSVQLLHENLKSLSTSLIQEEVPQSKTNENAHKESVLTVSLMDVIPLVSFASLLIEIAGRVEGLVEAVEDLAKLADFKPAVDEKPGLKSIN
ncbi:Aluminum-activated malate transporter 10 [Heracleum sosnowskyi]|uniref:Aluminum-activated malate transporter 10 n=1 Tax=Heracleum sosnowskyi TaxID=360622 RepID=A0AAD8IBZ6_9APIA|nr:Aluminum-activated malate transporter 10 [Heracleum sosnowskyi]